MADGNAAFANESVMMAGRNATFVDRDVFFTDGNAAARTFGRAHRRRPYHFSYGSCHKIAGEGLAAAQTRWYSRGEVLAAAQK